jgi:hypothetical protein
MTQQLALLWCIRIDFSTNPFVYRQLIKYNSSSDAIAPPDIYFLKSGAPTLHVS